MLAVAATLWLCAGTHAFGEPGSAEDLPCPERPHRIESFTLFAPSLDRSKRLFVYLPSGYGCADDQRYPVFYFNDGHDLFDWSRPPAELEPAFVADLTRRERWYGSWRLASQLERAAATGRLPPMIVVGIAADDGFRSRDLAPRAWHGSIEGGGARYGDFIASVVVPAIDERFRTSRDRHCRGIGGASMGGVSALQIGFIHRGLFGMVLSLSPVLTEPAFAEYVQEGLGALDRAPFLDLLVDFDDDRIGAADQAWFRTRSVSPPANDRRTILTRTPGGRHRIDSWSRRVIPALAQLFDARCR